ncbi:uncharacterized protein MKS88_000162 [Plasmodium brasilianum]|uniref:Fam-l protein n=1 Tax=Plasmodium malariae TaxID=5858 RepID=A0A1D3JGW7_PLAMA|nr:Plasmodium exported protein, unknown function [Plasmodium malariae]KAI4841569.1 hypothetical protein MKS88_000162 [Plasmodium brasilianum]SBT85509.1 Plasmodium exported protein, unknown function [Plasmodium malariae]
MEQNISIIFLIKILMFILIIRMCHFYSDMSRFNKILDENYGFGRKLGIRIYRLLGICIGDIYPYVADLELKIPYKKKKKNKQLFIFDNEKWDEKKKEKLYRNALYKEKLIKKLMKNKCTMLHGSYSHYEKKVMNGLNDNAFFEKMMLINDKDYNKLKRKKYGLRICSLILLFVLVLIVPIVDLSLSNFSSVGKLLNTLCTLVYGTASTSGQQIEGNSGTFWSSTCQLSNLTGIKVFGVLVYCLPIIILGIILILGISSYYKNSIKYKKIRFLEAFNEW